MGERSSFAGGDQRYLRERQYADAGRLADRVSLHLKYGTAAVPWFRWVRERLALTPGAAVLEVGSGRGDLWGESGPGVPAVPAGVRLSLVDVAPGILEVAVATARRAGVPVHRAMVADVERLPFPDGSFDVVVANHMLYHADSPPSAVGELARVLRPGGTLHAATNGDRHLAELGELRAEVFGVAVLDATVTAFGVGNGGEMLRACFEDVHWEDYEDELRCTDPDDVLTYLLSLPPGEGASEAQVHALRDAVRARFVASAGAFRVTKEPGLFSCRRPR